ncbi:LysR family transcriptional regulator [Desertifilum sp. FACHB-1129]|uniref:LysR family transcriptional regulator n=1 Tax=Desertifilum tharense IPPAS B-1220 TaxID=1781255 RepID=A0A1E5QGT0_9CYAN|nr:MULTISPECIES: LysR family transcriptional regulator [Desertifilum]MDA0213250.1 LysR substrate-binding domain-containing protein [Cyanobacteria bacterium FC1]MBD2314746.1 LysR family transcriptional regulator [Desertifilum sp. FACHB-1129]MBD2323931.1 LysR family transcriptional regulator [Desertifilum sp. FACHB-866]MBD2333776.1 LysR family transcriptional regulator [Desertifilum sp. FACHB-868]OEJ73797.1 LysR family transcriptional regulator [Desertifilum tharense IPPAS B-1220]
MKQATLHQLKVFEAAARHGSFTRAAEELFLTQPTVSMQVKQLTKIVGLPLFEQVGKRLFLTNAGEELFATCRDIFERLSQLEMTLSDLKGLKQGQLRLTVITTAKYFVPRLLGPFCQRYPGIEVFLQVTNHEGLVERLNNNTDDLYILSQVPTHLDLCHHRFLENPLVVLANRSHPLVNESNIPVQRLSGEPFIMRELGSGTRESIENFFKQHEIKVQVRLELGSNEAIKQAVVGGLGISILSLHTLALEGTNNKLAILDVQGFPIERYWYVVYPNGKQVSVVAQTFLEYLLNEGKQVAEETAVLKLNEAASNLSRSTSKL